MLQNLEGLHNLTVLSIQVISHTSSTLFGMVDEKEPFVFRHFVNPFLYIYFQSNRITKIEGLQNVVNLRELYLSHNGIEVIEGLENNVSYRNSAAHF